MNFKKIYQDNYCLIDNDDLLEICRSNYNDPKIEKFIIESAAFHTKERLDIHMKESAIADIGKLFSDAYMTKNYDEIQEYINKNNIQSQNLKILKSKQKMDIILKETIQDYLKLNKYIIKKELREYFNLVFPYCLKRGIVQYINKFFIPNK